MDYQVSKVFPNLFVSILKFSGVLPLNNLYKLNTPNIIYSLLLLMICLGVMIVSIPCVKYFEQIHQIKNPEFRPDTYQGFLMTMFVTRTYPVVMTLMPFTALCNALWKYKTHFPGYMDNLRRSDEFLKKDNVLIDKQKSFAVRFVSFCLSLSVPTKLFSITSLILLHQLEASVMFWIVGLYYFDIIGHAAEMQFLLMGNALRIRYQEINYRIESIFSLHNIKLEYKIRTFANSWKLEKDIGERKAEEKVSSFKSSLPRFKICKWSKEKSKIKKKAVDPIYVLPIEDYDNDSSKYFLLSDFVETKKKPSEFCEIELSSRIHNLRLSHRHLSIALQHLKQMFEYVFLVSLFALFLMILLNSYLGIYGFGYPYILSSRFDVLFWVANNALRFICPLIMSDFVTAQARKTLELLSSYASQTLTDATTDELNYFCEEIISRDLNISCAFDFFMLKTNLIVTAVGACTTYMVVLVQLHTSEL